MASALQECVYAQLRAPRILVGLDEQHRKLTTLIVAAIRDNQSTSVLCLGRPGTGKTACVNSVVSTLSAQSPGLRVVRLTGHLHAQPHVGLAEVLKQIGALPGEDEKAIKLRSKSPDDVIAALQVLLKRCAQDGHPIVLVLSSFERFAAQPRQTLLYSLLEITHASAAVVLIGVTSAFDALDQLEKRVRSRFSHLHVLFVGPQTAADIKLIIRGVLLVTDKSLAGAEQWNSDCEALLQSQDAHQVLTQHLQHTNDVRHFLNLLTLVVTRARPPTVEALQYASRRMLADVKAHFLQSLSLAEMVLVIVFSKLRSQGLTRINFELMWQHVSHPEDLLGSFWELEDKGVMLRVLERLVQLGVFRYVPLGVRSQPPAYRLLQLQASDAHVNQALVADAVNDDVSTHLKAWTK